jgi:hypothetical protein
MIAVWLVFFDMIVLGILYGTVVYAALINNNNNISRRSLVELLIFCLIVFQALLMFTSRFSETMNLFVILAIFNSIQFI